MTIHAVIFDIGGVLNKVQQTDSLRAWEARLGLADGQLAPLVFNNPITRLASLGQATPEDVWQFVNQQLHLPPAEFKQLQADVWSSYWWDSDLLAFIRRLRPRCKTAALSDAWVGAREQMKDIINGDTFDVIVYSSEEGIVKPDPEIFRRTLQRLGVPPSDAIFVDDKPRNAEAAQALGMHGIVFTDSAKVRQQILRMLE